MDLHQVENELKKRLIYPYVWGRKQSNQLDYQTNFIYNIFSFDSLIKEIETRFPKKQNYNEIFNYALNRWFNFWSAMALEHVFCLNNNVVPVKNTYDRLVDFSITGIKFDHKTTVFPRGFGQSLTFARSNPKLLALWLYENQSQGQRKHLNNRLFVVLYSRNSQHWRLKAEILWLKEKIDAYVHNFDQSNLIEMDFEGSEKVKTDIVWAVM